MSFVAGNMILVACVFLQCLRFQSSLVSATFSRDQGLECKRFRAATFTPAENTLVRVFLASETSTGKKAELKPLEH